MAHTLGKAGRAAATTGLSPQAAPYAMPLSNPTSSDEQVLPGIILSSSVRVVILVGCPGSGKSTVGSICPLLCTMDTPSAQPCVPFPRGDAHLVKLTSNQK